MEKFYVDDSLGKHLKLFDDLEKELIHYIFGNSGQDYQHNYVREIILVMFTELMIMFIFYCNVNYWGANQKEEEPTKKKIGID